MAKNAGGVLLPVSAEPGKGDGEAALFKGSAMTRRGAVAALSYMSCSGTRLDPRPLFLCASVVWRRIGALSVCFRSRRRTGGSFCVGSGTGSARSGLVICC